MMPNEEILKKLTGDIADEVPEATYRLAASLLVKAVEARAVDQLGADNAIRSFLNNNRHVGEAVVGFLLAAALELAPTPSLGDKRKRLAYNLRVRSYEELGGLLLHLTPFTHLLEEEVERAMRLARGELKLPVQPVPNGQEGAAETVKAGAESTAL